MEIKINPVNLQIPGQSDNLVDKARKFQGNDGKIDDNELKELIADAEQGGLNADEEQFLAAMMDQGVAKQLGDSNFSPTQLAFTVDDGKHAENLNKVHAIKEQLAQDPAQLSKAVAATQAADKARQEATAKALDAQLKAKTDKSAAGLDAVVQKHGVVKGDNSHFSLKEEKKFQAKVNGTAGLQAGDNHCASSVGQMYTDQGFKYPGKMGSTDKAVSFFLYKDYTAAKGKGLNPKFEAQKKSDEAVGNSRKLMLLKGGGGDKFKTYIKATDPSYDSAKNSYEYKDLPIRKGDMIFMLPKEEAPHGPNHAAMVKDYDPASGKMTVIQGNPLAENVIDLSKKEEREKIMGFGRPAASDFD